MDATKRSPTQLDVNPAPALADHERRTRTRVMMRAALAAMDAYERAVRADFDHARSLIAQVEGWLGGAPVPELFTTWRTIHQDLFSVVDTEAPLARAATALWQDLEGDLPFTDAAIGSTLDTAAGTGERTLSERLDVLRKELFTFADHSYPFLDDVAERFDSALLGIQGLPEDTRQHLEATEVAS